MANPPYLVAIDKMNRRIFVLAQPNLCALKINEEWQFTTPLRDEEIESYELITDMVVSEAIIKEAREALQVF